MRGFRRQQHRAQHQQPGEKGGLRARHRQRAPQRQPAGGDGAQQRWQTIGPDAGRRVRRARDARWRRPAANRCRRLFVARDMAEADVHHSCRISTIWREDWAKRLSSRSSGGRLRMPGSHKQQPQQGQQRQRAARPGRASQGALAAAGAGTGRQRGGFLSFFRCLRVGHGGELCRSRPYVAKSRACIRPGPDS